MNLLNALASGISLQKEKESVPQCCDGIIRFNSSPRNFASLWLQVPMKETIERKINLSVLDLSLGVLGLPYILASLDPQGYMLS